MSEWQPIETAPKDGREVLIADSENVGTGFYDDAPMAYRADAGWFWEMDRGNLLTAKNAFVTHWMPLPSPPVQPSQRAAVLSSPDQGPFDPEKFLGSAWGQLRNALVQS